ncbi:hypothetical protein EIP91_004529 [Steccherinum ochraceum]|uniref:Uncharacterized protein n=1 Tax=Steccherinum ochraceum TaxID=92696 RepID=A0A4R0RB76_9APHY|nr:hypothetical protein EIP91_004529 [Steccherinum ochraceum]
MLVLEGKTVHELSGVEAALASSLVRARFDIGGIGTDDVAAIPEPTTSDRVRGSESARSDDLKHDMLERITYINTKIRKDRSNFIRALQLEETQIGRWKDQFSRLDGLVMALKGNDAVRESQYLLNESASRSPSPEV